MDLFGELLFSGDRRDKGTTDPCETKPIPARNRRQGLYHHITDPGVKMKA